MLMQCGAAAVSSYPVVSGSGRCEGVGAARESTLSTELS
jgi:hypothetical protein